MSETIVIFVSGEVLADSHASTIPAQMTNADLLAEALYPVLAGQDKVLIIYGNEPQVGYVLLRSELAGHIVFTMPLDVCMADTQGATGYMLSQAFANVLSRKNVQRNIASIMTRTLVDANPSQEDEQHLRMIGPWFDRLKAQQNIQSRGWVMLEEPGLGYRRAVPSLPVLEILEFPVIKQMVDTGAIAIAGGGGGIPVVRDSQGKLRGIEAVVDTERVSSKLASQIQAKILLMVIEKDKKFLLSNLSTEAKTNLSLSELDELLANDSHHSVSEMLELQAAAEFLHGGGEQVIITTLRKLASTLDQKSGLRIGAVDQRLELFESK